MSFKEGQLDAQSVPRAREVPIAELTPAQAFEVGALGRLTVTGKFVEATSPAAGGDVSHVSQTPYGAPPTSGPFVGFGTIAGRREFPPGRGVVTEADACPFRAEYTGDIPAQVGGTFDAEKGADGKWRVDFSGAGDLVRYLRPIPDLDVHEDALAIHEVLVEFVQAGVDSAKTPIADAS